MHMKFIPSGNMHTLVLEHSTRIVMVVIGTELAKTMCGVLGIKSLTGLLYTLEAVMACPTLVRGNIHCV